MLAYIFTALARWPSAIDAALKAITCLVTVDFSYAHITVLQTIGDPDVHDQRHQNISAHRRRDRRTASLHILRRDRRDRRAL